MSNQQHTLDSLRVGDENMCVGELVLSSDCYPFYDDCGLIVGITFDKNDASRIVACVNASAGIETSSLEAINKHGVTLRQKLAGAQDQMIELEKQRDLLLSVLEKAFSALESCTPGDFSTGHVIYPSFDESLVADAYCEAGSVIASVKGGA